MSKVVLFVRVSTESQHLESQEDALRRAALYDGAKEDDIIVIGKKESAIKLDEAEREGLQELYDVIANNDVSCVYIHELSRLSRRPPVLYAVREKLLNAHVQLKCINPSFTLLTADRQKYDATANIVFSLFGAMAEQEMIEKKERFKRGKRRKAEEGKYNGGNIPFGYKKDPEHDNKIVVDEEKAAIVKLIFNLYENGYSQPKLARELHERGYTEMKISLINHILNNISYTGFKRCRKGSSYERVYPIIITPEQFDRCRNAADERCTHKFNEGNIYYADHLIRCESCGGIWSASGSKVRYRCYNSAIANSIWDYEYQGNRTKCTNKTGISINVLDSLLWYVGQRVECDYILNTAKEDREKYQEQINELEAKLSVVGSRLEEIDVKRERVADAYVDGLYSKSKRDEKLARLDEEKRDIQRRKLEMETSLSHLELLLSDVVSKYNLDDISSTVNALEQYDKLFTQISQIEDDKERRDLIHRHVKEVRVRDSQVMYKFNRKSGLKMCPAKFIKISLYNGKDLYYYYVCFAQLKNGVLEADKDGNVIKEINMPRLGRFVDYTKRRMHEKERQKQLAEREKLFPKSEGWIFGYGAIASILKLSSATIYRHVQEGHFDGAFEKLDGLNVFNVRKVIKCIMESGDKWSHYVIESWKRRGFDYEQYLK